MKYILVVLLFACLLPGLAVGQFSRPKPVVFNKNTIRFRAGWNWLDLNGDRRADVLAPDDLYRESGRYKVYWNLPGHPIGERFTTIALGQAAVWHGTIVWNRDTLPDLAVWALSDSGWYDKLVIFQNTGTGFARADSFPVKPATAALYDWDRDGDHDLVYLDPATRRITLRTNLGGTLSPDSLLMEVPAECGNLVFNSQSGASRIFITDWERDAKPDIMLLGSRPGSGGTAYAYRGTSSGFVADSGKTIRHVEYLNGYALEMTGDNLIDFRVEIANQTLRMYAQRPDGSFREANFGYPQFEWNEPIPADFDQDGHYELFQSPTVYAQSGGGRNGPYIIFRADTATGSIGTIVSGLGKFYEEQNLGIADMDGDGRDDLAFADLDYGTAGDPSTTVYWQRNLGGMNFGGKATLFNKFLYLAILPVKEPGLPEGLIGYDHQHIYFVPKGDTALARAYTVAEFPPIGMQDSVPNWISGINLLDMDGNGTKELVAISNRGILTLPVQENAPVRNLGGMSTNYFTATFHMGGSDGSQFADVRPAYLDFNGDGRLDVFQMVTNTFMDPSPRSASLYYYRQGQNGQLDSTGRLVAEFEDLYWAGGLYSDARRDWARDVNGDGKDDLVIWMDARHGGFDSQREIHVLQNSGTQAFGDNGFGADGIYENVDGRPGAELIRVDTNAISIDTYNDTTFYTNIFSYQSTLGGAPFRYLGIADMDGDSQNDFVAWKYRHPNTGLYYTVDTVLVFKGLGHGRFSNTPRVLPMAHDDRSEFIALNGLADVDGDGLADLLGATYGSTYGEQLWYKNTSSPLTALAKEDNRPSGKVLRLYPNPAHSSLHYTLPGNEKPASITLIDALGRSTPARRMDTNAISLTNRKPGVCILEVTTQAGQRLRSRFVVE